MLLHHIFIQLIYFLSLISILSNSYTLVYHTENSPSLQYFNCIYYTELTIHNSIQNVKYCYQLQDSLSYQLNFNQSCYNGGELWSFERLSLLNLSTSEILQWSSSMERLDQYLKYLSNTSLDIEDKFLCNCTDLSTFGKFCEYKYYYNSISFDDAIQKQFQSLEKDEINIGNQLHKNRPCYITWICDAGLMCLDWRYICDGKQQCMNGLDEDYCELLEFNECENDEYRCGNGMCIPEEYWLDSDYDCMDWTDEIHTIVSSGKNCLYNPSTICDEHICPYNQWSCGDGQCINDQTDRHKGSLANDESFCKNMRDINYMCESVKRYSRSWWTIDEGYCLPFPIAYQTLNLDTKSNDDNCTLFVKCALSNSLNQDCPCKNNTACYDAVIHSCPEKYLIYPQSNTIVSPFVYMIYETDRDWTNKKPDHVLYQGSMKCIGYQMISLSGWAWTDIEKLSFYDYIIPEYRLCNLAEGSKDYHIPLGPHYDVDCWNNSKTFNNHSYQVSFVCQTRCISKYRIRDGISDCYMNEEISTINNSCPQIQHHRLQCSSSELTCLLTGVLGNWGTVCSNGRDEFDYETNSVLFNNLKCNYRHDPGCIYIQNYIRMSSNNDNNINKVITNKNVISVDYSSRAIPFRSYCNSFFDTISGIDESSEFCEKWTCLNDEYQCLSGQCIPQNWICDGEWDCSDASDEQRIFLMNNLNDHNSKLMNLTTIKTQCYQQYRIDNTPFANICNISFEYGCFRKDVNDPFNLTLNRPCINITQIGDGNIDCLSSLDERNRLQCPTMGMLGFHFQLNDQLCATYRKLCIDYPWIPGINLDYDSICFYQKKQFQNGTISNCDSLTDVMCLNDVCKKNARCNGKIECLYGEDEYRCIPSDKSPFTYRWPKQSIESSIVLKLSNYPLIMKSFFNKSIFDDNNLHSNLSSDININNNISDIPMMITLVKHTANLNEIQNLTIKSVYDILSETLPNGTITPEKHFLPFICNRGLAVNYINMGFVCLCPPSFYGGQCEFYSDRITILTHLDLTNYHSNLINISIIKILTTFLFQSYIIDYYEFYVNPLLENENNYIKKTIYFLYSRNEVIRSLKQVYRNGTQLYYVQFEAFNLYFNETIEPIGIWKYQIYFDFLPSFRLSKILRFSSSISLLSNNLCLNNPCGSNGICQIFNSNHSSYFCSCSSGYYGIHCELYDNKCHDYCSPKSICKPLYRGILTGNRYPLCLCPVSTFGSTCYIKNTKCQSNPCLNGGSCIIVYDMSNIDKYICICTNLYNGNYCQYSKGMIEITIELSSNSTLQILDIIAVTISYNNYDLRTLQFDIQYQQVHHFLPLYIQQMYNYKVGTYAPTIAIMKVYGLDYQNKEAKYYILYYYPNQKDINITIDLTLENYCPLIETIEISNYSNNLTLNSTTSVFFYHHLCQNKKHMNRILNCFRDINYLCICEKDYERAECFGYNYRIDQCSLCLSNGYCLKGNLDNSRDFLCLCSHCHYGQMCQYSNEFMSFTLDSLIIKDTIQNSQIFSFIYISIILVIFLFGLFNNLCSFLTFIQPKSRKFGVGNYLLIISIINQCSLLILFLKVIHIIFGSNGTLFFYYNSHLYLCKMISYLLSVLTRITYWLTSFVTVERLCIVLFPTSTLFKNVHLAIGLSLFAILIVSSMHIHEILYYRTIVDSSYNSTIVTLCVTNYTASFVSIYNRVNVLIHYFIPFLLQVISITITIIQTACSRARTSGSKQEKFRDLFKKQLKMQKEHYITPIIIVFSSLPQAILSFSYACSELKQSWQRYTLLITYFLSYLPQMLGFILHVLPSTTFSNEFHKTIIGKRLLKQQRAKIIRQRMLKRRI